MFRLFFSFLRLGLTAFGGPSMVVYIRNMTVDKKRWLDEETFRDGVALCQMIPGATAMQTAAYVGIRTRGAIGAGAAFVGFGLPAFILMMTLSALYASARTLPVVVSAFAGLQAIIVAIVANATVSFGRTSLETWKHVLIAGAAAVLFALGLHPIAVILLAALGGLVLLRRPPALRSTDVDAIRQRSSQRPLLVLVAATVVWFLALFATAPDLFELAALMFRIDLFAFGGAFASVPLMYHEIVDARGWMDGQTFLNGIVLGQVTPGPIVITATFAGYWLHGFLGGLVATVSVFLPSFLMVVGIVPHLDRLRASPYFNKIVGGVLCSFVGLLLTVTFRFAVEVNWDVGRILLAGAAFGALLFRVDILWVVLAGTVISVVAFR